MEAIRSLCRRQGREAEAAAREKHNVSLENLSQGQASELIRFLNAPKAAA